MIRAFHAAALVASLLLSPPVLAQTQTGAATGLQISNDKPIQIESDELEVHEEDGIAIFSGNVAVVQGDNLLKSGRMTVHYGEGGTLSSGTSNIQKIEMDGKVYMKSKDQVATGDRGVYDMKSSQFVLTGDKVVLSQGKNVAEGCKLTANTQTGRARLDGCGKSASGGDGRVKTLLQPQKQSQ